MKRALIPCVHDVTPRHFDRLRRIDATLRDLGLGGRYSMLVVPRFWNDWDLRDHPEFCAWLKARADEGVEMLLHGWVHQDDTVHMNPVARWKGSVMTASEGEFLGLDYSTAAHRISQGRLMLEELLDGPVTGFVAPAWLYSEDTHRALRDLGFTVAEDHLRVWNPRTGESLTTSPVISYASRTRSRVISSLVWSRIGTTALDVLPVVRHAIHPHDLDVEALETEIVRSLRQLLRTRRPVRYDALAAG